MDLNSAIIEIAQHSRLFHIYRLGFAPLSFNPTGHGSRRFDPIFAKDGQVIPSFYAADHYICAFAEVLMRKDDEDKHQFTHTIYQHGLVQLDLNRSLKLLDISQLPKLNTMMQQGNKGYSGLKKVSQWVAQNHPDISGLSWDGAQRAVAGQRCVIFFGDRVGQNDFELRINEPLTSVHSIRMLKDAARSLHCDLPDNLVQ
jgi:hypothetical protein